LKKISFLIIILIGLIILSSCTGLGYKGFPKRFSSWHSENDSLEFDFQGYCDNYGLGFLMVNEEKIKVAVYLDIVSQVLVVFRYEDILIQQHFIVFQIRTYRSGFQVESNRIKLTTEVNNTDDVSFDDAEFDIVRYDLDDSQIDAKYYAGTSWENVEYGIKLISDYKSDFTHIITGVIKYQSNDLMIEFHFLENQEFVIYAEDLVIMAGTYETSDLTIKLNFVSNELYTGLPFLIMHAFQG